MERFACIASTGAEFTRFRENPKYAEGLYDLGNDVFAWMTPNGSWGESNAGLVVGDGESLLVDTLWDVKYTRTMLDALDKILGMDVDVIVPGHGPVTDKHGVETVKAFWIYVEDQVRRRFEAGMAEKEAAFDIVSSESFAQSGLKDWNSPERMMVNVHTIYRNLKGDPKPPTIIEMIKIFSKQALLAYRLPNAQPEIMRRMAGKAL